MLAPIIPPIVAEQAGDATSGSSIVLGVRLSDHDCKAYVDRPGLLL